MPPTPQATTPRPFDHGGVRIGPTSVSGKISVLAAGGWLGEAPGWPGIRCLTLVDDCRWRAADAQVLEGLLAPQCRELVALAGVRWNSMLELAQQWHPASAGQNRPAPSGPMTRVDRDGTGYPIMGSPPSPRQGGAHGGQVG